MTLNHSRPRVSNDNAISEAQFQTQKYQPDYPKHFATGFKRQLFGEKSEKRFIDNPNQLGFGIGILGALPDEDTRPEETVSYTRKKGPKRRPEDCVTDSGLRFDASVPIKTIRLTPHDIEGLDEDQYEIIDIDKTYRLAQRPASSVVLCYERPVVKLKRFIVR